MKSRIKEFFTIYPVVFYEWFKALIYLIYGSWKILKMPEPRITFFGGSKHEAKDPHAKSAYDIAKNLVENNISILTGGGPGIMETANCGATYSAKLKKDKFIRSFGINVRDLPGEGGANRCAQDFIVLDYFFARKWLLMRYSVGFVIFPGGFGTIDEVTELITLIQTKKMKKVPVILFGKEFWQPLLDWLDNVAVKEGLISKETISLVQISNDKNEVCEILIKHCEKK